MEECVVPLGRQAEDEDELEEERRLAYVGITRAEEVLYVTNASSRMLSLVAQAIINRRVSCVKLTMTC